MDIKLPDIPKYPEALQQLSKLELVTLVLQQQALLEQLPNSLKIAKQLFHAGKFDDALKQFQLLYQTLIKLNPNFSWNYYYLGRLLAQEGRWFDAITNYRKAIELNPNAAHFYKGLAEAFIEQGKLDEAIHCSQKAICLQPYWDTYYQTLALAYETKSNFVSAFKTWQKILFLNPYHLKASQKISWLQTDVARDCVESGDKLNKEGAIGAAVAFYQQALVLNPQQPMSTYRNFGNNLITLDRLDEAETVFVKFIETYPELPDGYHGYARVAHSCANWELALQRWSDAIVKFPENIDFQVQKGNALINSSRFNEAESIFTQLKEKYPDQPQGYEGYARIIHHLGYSWELALKRWSEAIVRFPDHINFQVQKGNVLINLSRFDEAGTVFKHLKQKYPDQPQGYEGYARLVHYLADWKLALQLWSEAILRFPDYIDFQVQKGNVLLKLNRLHEARLLFQQLNLKQKQHHLNYQVKKGDFLIKSNRFDEAEAVFQDIIQKYPRHYHGYEGYGRVANTLLDWELALERWEDAIAKLPHYFDFYLQKGDALANLFRYEDAEAWWEKVIAKYPYRHEGLSKSATLARKLENREFAWQRFEEIIRKFPWYLPAYCEAAKELIAMGRFAEAEEKLQEALQRNPNHLTVLLQAGILASQQGNRELALERFERVIGFYHPQQAIDAYILAATELKYLGREHESEAKYEEILSFHRQCGLYSRPRRLRLGVSRLSFIHEVGLLLDRMVKKQPDSVEDVVYLSRLTDEVLMQDISANYPVSIDKDAISLLPKLKILKELFVQFLATQENCIDEALLVLKHFNMAIQLLEKESQRLNSSEWVSVKLVGTEIPLPLIDKLCFEGLSSSARYVMGTDERVPKSQVEATVKYLPELMDEEKKNFAASVRKLTSSLKLRSRQTVEIFKDFIFEPPFGISEEYILRGGYYHNGISQEFINELDHDKTGGSKKISYVALNATDSQIDPIKSLNFHDPRTNLEKITVSKKILDNYYQDDLVFGVPNVWGIWGAYQNYGHLLLDQIPSLILYQKLNLSCKIFVPHITDAHWEIFDALNIPKEKILVKQEQKFKYFMIGRYQYDAEMIRFYRNLRESIVAKRRDIPSEYRARYVYISRRYSGRRAMVNEVEVEELMVSLGFSIIYGERLSFEEKAMLMHHTSVVVGTIGAGMSIILMCHPNTTIVEFLSDFYIEDRFYYPVSVLGKCDFYPLYCNKTLDGLEMNIDKLKKVITTILEGG
jgi:tetratricopeptide (TPR) repeat protein